MSGSGDDFDRWRTRGDSAALARVFDAQAPALLRFAVHLVGDPNVAEDLVQDTFVTALRRADTYDAKRPIERWLAGILARHAQELRRDARRRVPHEPPELLDSRTPLDDVRTAEEREVVAAALDRLEEPYRSAAVLHVVHGLSAAEIAHALDRSPGAVRVHLHRAREMLRSMLPIGIAGAIAALVAPPARGLEAVRAVVLKEAAAVAPSAVVIGASIGGMLVVKKLVVAAVVVLALALGILWARREPDLSIGATPAPPAVEIAAASDATARAAIAAPISTSAESRRADVVAPPVGSSARQPFGCRVVDGLTGAPIAGAKLAFYAPKRSRWSEVIARWPERYTHSIHGVERAHDWPWLREQPTLRHRLDLEPVLSYEGPVAGDEPVATATSGADGGAVVELAADHAFVVAEHASYATRGMPPQLERTVSWRRGDKLEKKTFRDDVLIVKLFRPRALRGQVIDVDGKPIARAFRLRLDGWCPGDELEGGMRNTHAVDSWTITTAPDGSFATEVAAVSVRVRALEPGWTVLQTARNPDRDESWVFGLDRETGTGRTEWIPMRAVPALTVRNAADGTPVRDYWLQARMPQRGWPTSRLVRVRSDDGSTPIVEGHELQGARGPRGFDARAYHVFAAGYAPGVVECADPLASTGLELALVPGTCPTIEGRVVDGDRSVAGADVLLEASDEKSWDCEMRNGGIAARTDAEGRFSLPAAPGGWGVRAELDGRSQCRFVAHPSPEPVVIDIGRDTRIEIVVAGERGTFAEFQADITLPNGAGQFSEIDEDGRALFRSLQPGRYAVKVHQRGVLCLATPGDAEFDLALGESRTVRFARERAVPARPALLVVEGRATLEGWKARRFDVSEWTDVAPDGRAAIDVSGEHVRVLVRAPDARTYGFRVAPEATDPVVLRLVPGRGGRAGLLRRRDGTPCANRVVSAQFAPDENGLVSSACPADREGRFSLDALPPGARYLAVHDARGNTEYDGYAGISFQCDETSTGPLTIEVPGALAESRPIALHGTVRRAGEVDGGRTLWIRALYDGPGGTLAVSTTTTVLSDGSYTVATLPAPRHAASCWYGGGQRFDEEFTLPLDVPDAQRDFDAR